MQSLLRQFRVCSKLFAGFGLVLALLIVMPVVAFRQIVDAASKVSVLVTDIVAATQA